MNKMVGSLDYQAEILANYLLGRQPSQTAKKLYRHSLSQQPPLSRRQRKTLDFGIGHPALLGLLDSGLAITNPRSELRRRIYLMFSILESLPENSDKFLPRKRSLLYGLVILVDLVIASLSVILGLVFVVGLKLLYEDS